LILKGTALRLSCLIVVSVWVLAGVILGCATTPPDPRFITKSPDGTKEFYLYRPLHRRIIKVILYPVEWPITGIALLVAGNPIGGLYFADYSFYVRHIPTGHSDMYAPDWIGVWSPDSRWIACAGPKRQERTSLLLVDTVEKKELIIPNPDAPRNWAISTFAWSEDSDAVFFQQEYTVYALEVASRKLFAISRDEKDDTPDLLQLGSEWKTNVGQITPQIAPHEPPVRADSSPEPV
jgi:hypothetical protein